MVMMVVMMMMIHLGLTGNNDTKFFKIITKKTDLIEMTCIKWNILFIFHFSDNYYHFNKFYFLLKLRLDPLMKHYSSTGMFSWRPKIDSGAHVK